MSVSLLIPARGGSKGIYRKNLAKVGGKSLLEWAITAGHASQVGKVYVTSDDEPTLEEARVLGAEVHRRATWAASDDSTAADVIEDFLASHSPETIVYLQPTSPFRTHGDIRDAWHLFCETNRPVVAISRVIDHPHKCVQIREDGGLYSPNSNHLLTANRQSLTPTFRHNGAIYIFSSVDFNRQRSIPIVGATGFIMDSVAGLDIDDEISLAFANFMWERKNGG